MVLYRSMMGLKEPSDSFAPSQALAVFTTFWRSSNSVITILLIDS